VLERGGGGLTGDLGEFTDELPTGEGVEDVDITRLAVEHSERGAAARLDQPRELLVRVAAVPERDFRRSFHDVTMPDPPLRAVMPTA
jgi:hypothetical protein